MNTTNAILGCTHQPPCARTEAAAIEAAPLRSFVIVETGKGHEVWPDPDGPITAVFTERADADLFVFAASLLPTASIEDRRAGVRGYWKRKQQESRQRRRTIEAAASTEEGGGDGRDDNTDPSLS